MLCGCEAESIVGAGNNDRLARVVGGGKGYVAELMAKEVGGVSRWRSGVC